VRLHKFIANSGFTSRRRAELLIQAGRVAINGRVVTSLGCRVKPGDAISVNGEELRLPEPLTILLNKPAGIITSTHDTHERLTVMDILPRSLHLKGVVPAGRLDQETEGLLVLTNDGDLNHRITHPRFETEKEYLATVEGRPTARAFRQLEEGVMLDGQRTARARVEVVEDCEEGSRLRITIHEGRKRQVRRMLAAVGNDVVHLRRVRIGGLGLGDLAPGEWRELNASEIEALLAPQ
jgi:23S rRNA pseudouridine2605 synthase